jgi:hypothetical protein
MDFLTPNAPNQSGRGGRTATTKFYALRGNLLEQAKALYRYWPEVEVRLFE